MFGGCRGLLTGSVPFRAPGPYVRCVQIFDRPAPPPRPSLRRRLAALALPPSWGKLGAVRLARRPLTWLVAAECVVCLALVGAAWHLVSAAAASAGAGVPAAAPGLPALGSVLAPSDPSPPALPQASGSAAAAQPGRPGLGTSGAFLGDLINGLNQDQASFENSEWTALQALSGAIRGYIEGVMLPAVLRAERSRPAGQTGPSP